MSRGRARFHDSGARRAEPAPLHGARGALAGFACLLPLAGGFLVPAGLLLHMAWTAGDAQLGAKYLRLAGNSLTLALLASFLTVALALLLAYAARLHPGWLTRGANRVASLGYATPGTVIAVAVLIPLSAVDNALDAWMRARFGVSTGLLLTGGIAALLYAYVVRFLSVALQGVEASLARIRPSMDEAARSLGAGRRGLLLRVHVPMLRGGLAAAALLVFVDVMKELPATIVMRPFNFDTLATQVFVLAADERLAEAATPSLAIVAVGLIPVVLLARTLRRR
jgi:iron(III) transport system permease protein